MKKIFFLFFLLSLVINFSISSVVLANDLAVIMDSDQRLQATLNDTGLYTANRTDPSTIAIRVIRIALGFVGLIFFIQILMSGFQWMTSSANPEKLKKAKQKITNSIIGLTIIICAYLITVAITAYLLQAITAS